MSKMENTFLWGKGLSNEQIQQDLSNYYTKPETNTLLDKKQNILSSGDDIGVTTRSEGNYCYITPKWKDKINLIETKQDKIINSDNITIDSNNKLWLAPGVLDGYATTQWVNDNFVTYTYLNNNFYSRSEVDEKIRQNNSPMILPTSPDSEIINLPNGRRLIKFQMTIPNDLQSDWWGNIPQEIKNITNINRIEGLHYNVFSEGTCYQCIDLYVKVSTYANRLYISSTAASSNFWRSESIRFSIIVS